MNIVEAKELTKNYGSLLALDSIDFDIAKGECFGFLGPNGAGKTTAMSIIYCFMPPTSGYLRIFGMDANKHMSEIKARTGVMPQEDNLDLELSVFENLIVYARYFNIPRDKASVMANELLEFVELTEKESINIRIIGMNGMEVYGEVFENTFNQTYRLINLQLENGIYLLHAGGKFTNLQSKIVILN